MDANQTLIGKEVFWATGNKFKKGIITGIRSETTQAGHKSEYAVDNGRYAKSTNFYNSQEEVLAAINQAIIERSGTLPSVE